MVSPLFFALIQMDEGTAQAWKWTICMYACIILIIPPAWNYLQYGYFKYYIPRTSETEEPKPGFKEVEIEIRWNTQGDDIVETDVVKMPNGLTKEEEDKFINEYIYDNWHFLHGY